MGHTAHGGRRWHDERGLECDDFSFPGSWLWCYDGFGSFVQARIQSIGYCEVEVEFIVLSE